MQSLIPLFPKPILTKEKLMVRLLIHLHAVHLSFVSPESRARAKAHVLLIR